MSITLINLQSFTSGFDNAPSIAVGEVSFNVECLVNQSEIIGPYNVIWIRNGSSVVEIDFVSYHIAPETIFFLAPGQIFTVLSEEIISGYRMAFQDEFYSVDAHHTEIGCNGLLFNNFVDSPILKLTSEAAQVLGPVFEEISDNVAGKGPAQAEILLSYLKIFLTKCVQFKKQSFKNQVHQEEIWLTEFNHLLEKHFREWHAVADYADALNIAPKSLNKRFAKLHASPSQLIKERLILEAKRQLLYSDKSVKEVAYSIGFEDTSYFSRFFKKQTGKSPTDFLQH